MKGLSKRIIAIVVCAIIIGIIAILPGFAETQDQLKSVFVTREDVGKWVKYAESKLAWAESVSNWQIYIQCSSEMAARGVIDKNESIDSTTKEFQTYNETDYSWP